MCLLGEQCPFDHGNDPLVITGMPPYPPPPPPPPFPISLPPHPPHHHITKTNAGKYSNTLYYSTFFFQKMAPKSPRIFITFSDTY